MILAKYNFRSPLLAVFIWHEPWVNEENSKESKFFRCKVKTHETKTFPYVKVYFWHLPLEFSPSNFVNSVEFAGSLPISEKQCVDGILGN